MKKYMALILALLCILVFAGCMKKQPAMEEKWDLIPMVMVDDVLYLDTGFANNDIDDGTGPDGEIISQVDGSEEPTANDQSNFGVGYRYRYGEREGTVELDLNGKWRVFATEEVRQQIQFPDQYDETVSEVPGATVFVVDIWDRAVEEQLPCDEVVEKFYEDETNEYYFSCIKSHYIMVLDSTGRTVDIVTALNEGLITIADLDYYGVEYYAEPK